MKEVKLVLVMELPEHWDTAWLPDEMRLSGLAVDATLGLLREIFDYPKVDPPRPKPRNQG